MQTLQCSIKCHTGLDLWLSAISLHVYIATQYRKAETATLLTSFWCTKCLYLMFLPLKFNPGQFYKLRAGTSYQFNRVKLLDKNSHSWNIRLETRRSRLLYKSHHTFYLSSSKYGKILLDTDSSCKNEAANACIATDSCKSFDIPSDKCWSVTLG